jgi:hypothetical protein
MSFDAGAITGSLKLDGSEFSHGIQHAAAESAAFPAIVVHFLEEPMLAFAEVVRKSFETIFEWVGKAAEDFHAMGLAALRTGTQTEWLSRLAANAKVAGVGLDSLVAGFKILEQRAELAVEGNEAAVKGFARLGIGIDELKGLMESPQELFTRVQEAIGSIGEASLRTSAALGVMGRGGFNLVPILAKSSEESKRFADIIERLGGTVTEQQAQMGEKFGELEGIFDAAWAGIKRAVAEPILKVFTDNMEELTSLVVELTTAIRDVLRSHGREIEQFLTDALKAAIDFARTGLPEIKKSLEDLAVSIGAVVNGLKELSQLWGIVSSAASLAGSAVGIDFGQFGATAMALQAAGVSRAGDQPNITVKVDAPVDVNDATTQIAAKVRPAILDAHKKAKEHLDRAVHHEHVSRSLKGVK